MARKRSVAELEYPRQELPARAEEAFAQMFGTDEQNGLVSFTEREDRACELTHALARWLLEESATGGALPTMPESFFPSWMNPPKAERWARKATVRVCCKRLNTPGATNPRFGSRA